MKCCPVKMLIGPLVALVGLSAAAMPGIGLAKGFTLGASPPGDAAALVADGVDAAIEALPSLVQEVMERSGVPGMAVAVVHDGKVVFLEGFGVRNVDTGEPV